MSDLYMYKGQQLGIVQTRSILDDHMNVNVIFKVAKVNQKCRHNFVLMLSIVDFINANYESFPHVTSFDV